MTKILVVKKRRESSKLKAKVTDKVNKGYTHTDYSNSVELLDYKQLALLLQDLKLLLGAPVDKAVKYMKSQKSPFW